MQSAKNKSVYSALKAEVTRLKGQIRRPEFSHFLAEYVYGPLSLLDIVALIGGEPSRVLYGPAAPSLLEHPKPKAVAQKVLALMQVSEDWQTFRDLYGKGFGGRDESGFKVARERLVAVPARRQARVAA